MGRGSGINQGSAQKLLFGPSTRKGTSKVRLTELEWRLGEFKDHARRHRQAGGEIALDGGLVTFYKKGKVHALGGPAIIEEGGRLTYKQNDQLHCEDGPAIAGKDSAPEWWLEGEQIANEKEFSRLVEERKQLAKRVARHKKLGGEVIQVKIENSYTVFTKDGEQHADDGPAVVITDGRREWWSHGKLHREDGPAIIEADGGLEWYQNGQLHREDGPAWIYADGKRYFRHGIEIEKPAE